MSHELISNSIQERTIRAANGDMEILISLKDGTYQLALEHSYGNEVLNPSEGKFADFVHGRSVLKLGKHKLLFGITLNGVCPADCMACPYGRTIMKEQYQYQPNRRLTQARPISPSELEYAFKRAHAVAVGQNIMGHQEGFAAGALLAGDPGYSPHVAELIALVSEFPGCEACRWSTIGPDTGNNVFDAFLQGARRAKVINPDHTPSFQVSLHSTDVNERIRHTGVERLVSMAGIARASEQIKTVTGRRMSLSFVLHKNSQIDPDILCGIFSPDSNIISLRPIYSPTVAPMEPEKLIELYSRLRADGWDVVYMPPNQGNGGDVPPIELHNMRTQSTGL